MAIGTVATSLSKVTLVDAIDVKIDDLYSRRVLVKTVVRTRVTSEADTGRLLGRQI